MAKLKTIFGESEHPVVSRAEWTEARQALLAKEKELTHLRDQLAQERRKLPWVRIDKEYLFDGPDGKESLPQLFGLCHQLLVYHFMFGPDWKEGCDHCSFWADTFNGIIVHLKARDTTMLAISQGPLAKLNEFKKRMGWSFKWVSSANNDFNYDFQAAVRPEEKKAGKVYYNYREIKPFADQMPGVSAFYKDDDGVVYHTYSAYSRGIDIVNAAYTYLDLTAKGRDEDWSKSNPSDWVRYHDKYGDTVKIGGR